MSFADLVSTLQLSIGPVILISGVGLLLLSMTNRFGRVVDRSRILAHDLRGAVEPDSQRIQPELKILATRARIMRVAIASASLSVLLAAILVISLFIGAVFALEVTGLVVALFILCMISLIVSLLLFISDTNHSLKALWLEIPAEVRRNSQ